jgi:hypothetical protein
MQRALRAAVEKDQASRLGALASRLAGPGIDAERRERERDRFDAAYAMAQLRASRKASKSLTRATWVLAGATVVLAVATIVLAFK